MNLSDRYIDIRVDDHSDPITELERLLSLQRTVHLCVESARLAADGNFEEAIAKAELALAREPADVNVQYFLARAYMLAGQKTRAFRILEQLSSRHPGVGLLIKQDRVFQHR